ncbi:hypothetical protein NDU88_012413 [Pleurodeles waltl]|uniref:Uncharacterized protein n=1 Tax=Pleurodeles waltl TaxID=8319 RepID=A0AAV7R0L0_PLEWA|nr:hypothetical protein NDU88_012413 [Pleurodeles waltl]
MRLRLPGVFHPGRGSAALTSREVRVWSAASITSRVLSSPNHTSDPARPRQKGPPIRHQLGRESPAPAAILFSGVGRAAARERGLPSLIAHHRRLPRVQGSQGLLERRLLLGQTMLATGG